MQKNEMIFVNTLFVNNDKMSINRRNLFFFPYLYVIIYGIFYYRKITKIKSLIFFKIFFFFSEIEIIR